jgi:transketolase N-terminal domain/subunit
VALRDIRQPSDLRQLDHAQLAELAEEIRQFIVDAVAVTGGHLGSNLGAVELTLALHRVFDSPRDAILWDTGHQAYVHKIVTGRAGGFSALRQAGGISGYPSREESPHDLIENSHASTVLSYAYGLAVARDQGLAPDRRHVVAVIGDGSMTGGMAYEALNNLGHSGKRVIVVLNDNGRSYAPTVSNLYRAADDDDEHAPTPSTSGGSAASSGSSATSPSSARRPSAASRPSRRACASSSSRPRSSRRSACGTSARSTATISPPSSTRWRAHGCASTRVRSWCTSSRRRVAAIRRRRTTTRSTCTTRRCSTPSADRRSRCRRATRRPFPTRS